MGRIGFHLEILLVACAATVCAACDDDATEQCVDLCEECPEYLLAPSAPECERWCDAWADLGELTGCVDTFERTMECLDGLSECGREGGQCDGRDYSLVDCTEQYCRLSPAHREQCQDVWRSNGIPVGSDPPN